MRTIRILALSAAALVGLSLLTAPSASAATAVTIDCGSATSTNFTVTPGEEITFTLNDTCKTYLQGSLSITTDIEFAAFVNGIVQRNTGPTITAVWEGIPLPQVTYVAGSTPGTDSLILTAGQVDTMTARLYRVLATVNAYYMTVPGGAGPAPWPQAIGRAGKDATCPATYGPSWAQWPNGGTGGWVCVREYYYNTSSAIWDYRLG